MEGKSDHQKYKSFKPGQMAPISGVYTVVHVRHRAPHEVVAIRGEEFPLCRVCQSDVRFFAEHVVSHMTHDIDLAGPLLIDQVKARANKRSA